MKRLTPEEKAEWLAAFHRLTAYPLGSMPYREYLLSSEWLAKRREVFQRANFRCEKCGKGGWLQVHHLTYERRGYELLEDLMALCADCHAGMHGRESAATRV
jgi:5-methylcytosine-specific restriction endonuclease McrA